MRAMICESKHRARHKDLRQDKRMMIEKITKNVKTNISRPFYYHRRYVGFDYNEEEGVLQRARVDIDNTSGWVELVGAGDGRDGLGSHGGCGG